MLKHHFPFLKETFNNKGITILEVLVAAGLASIISLGIVTMMQNMFVEQKRIVLFSTLKELKNRIEYLARDPSSWSQTLNVTAGTYNNNTIFVSMRGQTAVTQASSPNANPESFILFDASGAIAMNLIPAGGPPVGNGFTESGASCTTFNGNAGAGVDACPISYRLLIGVQCPNGVSCNTPLLRIVGRLLYNPAPGGILGRFRNLIAQIPGVDISSTSNVGKYDAVVERTPNQGNRSFTIASQFISAVGSLPNCTENGAGTCTTSITVHPITASNGWTSLVSSSLVSFSGPNFTITEPGAYTCVVTLPAFATDGFTAQLYNATTAQVIGSVSTTAGKWAQSTAMIDAKFNVPISGTSDNYVIRQRCDAVPTAVAPGDTNVGNCSLGVISSGSYYLGVAGAVSIVNVSCYKFDSM